jgi:hypothetical protein
MLRSIVVFVTFVSLLGAAADGATPVRRAMLFKSRYGVMPDFYVDTNGSDSNSCRMSSAPCATIAGAQSKLRAVLGGAGQMRPWLVQVHGGTYELQNPLVFSAGDSGGSAINRVIWHAAPGATVVISGGRQLGTMSDNSGIWEITVPELQSGQWNPRNFWVNDERRLHPRAANFASYLVPAAYGTAGSAPTNHINQITYSGTDVDSSMANYLDAALWVPLSWTAEYLPIAGIDSAGKVVTTTAWTGGGSNVNSTSARYFVDNVFEKLATQNKTFYVNRTPNGTANFDGRLQYKPGPGETVNTMRMVIPVLDQLLFVSNTDDGTATAKNITFKGLTFAHTDRRPAEYSAYLGDGSGITNPAAINVAGASNIVFDGVTVRNTGGAGIQLGAGCNSCQVINSTFGDLGGPGVMVTTWVAGSSSTTVPYFAHNLIPNPKFAGGGVGSTGPLWLYSAVASGLTISIVGTGHENGIPYIDVRVSGTNSSGTNQDRVIRSSSMPIAIGDMIDFGGYIRLVSGGTNMTGINFVTMGATLRDVSDAFVSNTISDTLMQKTSATIASSNLASQPVSAFGYVINNAGASKITQYLKVQVAAGASVDVTIRFGGVKMAKRTYWRKAIASASGPQTIQNTVIRNNFIQGVGQVDASSGCIVITHSRNATIENNDCSDSYRMGFQAGLVVGGSSYNAGTGIYTPDPNPIADNVEVRANYIHSIGRGVLSDFGGVYLAHNMPGTKIYENVIYNVLGHGSPDACIYADEDASNFEVFRNTCVNIGGPLFFHHRGINADVHNNIGYNVQSATIAPAMQMRGAAYSSKVDDQGNYTNVNDSFYRNVVRYTEQQQPDLPRLYGDKRNILDNGPRIFHNNLYQVLGGGADPGTVTWAFVDYQAGASYRWGDWINAGQDSGTAFGDPGWMGSAPMYYPTNKPSGWVDWKQSIAGLTDPGRALGFPTPVAAYP